MDELVVKDLIDRLIHLSIAEEIGDWHQTTMYSRRCNGKIKVVD